MLQGLMYYVQTMKEYSGNIESKGINITLDWQQEYEGFFPH